MKIRWMSGWSLLPQARVLFFSGLLLGVLFCLEATEVDNRCESKLQIMSIGERAAGGVIAYNTLVSGFIFPPIDRFNVCCTSLRALWSMDRWCLPGDVTLRELMPFKTHACMCRSKCRKEMGLCTKIKRGFFSGEYEYSWMWNKKLSLGYERKESNKSLGGLEKWNPESRHNHKHPPLSIHF